MACKYGLELTRGSTNYREAALAASLSFLDPVNVIYLEALSREYGGVIRKGAWCEVLTVEDVIFDKAEVQTALRASHRYRNKARRRTERRPTVVPPLKLRLRASDPTNYTSIDAQELRRQNRYVTLGPRSLQNASRLRRNISSLLGEITGVPLPAQKTPPPRHKPNISAAVALSLRLVSFSPAAAACHPPVIGLRSPWACSVFCRQWFPRFTRLKYLKVICHRGLQEFCPPSDSRQNPRSCCALHKCSLSRPKCLRPSIHTALCATSLLPCEISPLLQAASKTLTYVTYIFGSHYGDFKTHQDYSSLIEANKSWANFFYSLRPIPRIEFPQVTHVTILGNRPCGTPLPDDPTNPHGRLPSLDFTPRAVAPSAYSRKANVGELNSGSDSDEENDHVDNYPRCILLGGFLAPFRHLRFPRCQSINFKEVVDAKYCSDHDAVALASAATCVGSEKSSCLHCVFNPADINDAANSVQRRAVKYILGGAFTLLGQFDPFNEMGHYGVLPQHCHEWSCPRLQALAQNPISRTFDLPCPRLQKLQIEVVCSVTNTSGFSPHHPLAAEYPATEGGKYFQHGAAKPITDLDCLTGVLSFCFPLCPCQDNRQTGCTLHDRFLPSGLIFNFADSVSLRTDHIVTLRSALQQMVIKTKRYLHQRSIRERLRGVADGVDGLFHTDYTPPDSLHERCNAKRELHLSLKLTAAAVLSEASPANEYIRKVLFACETLTTNFVDDSGFTSNSEFGFDSPNSKSTIHSSCGSNSNRYCQPFRPGHDTTDTEGSDSGFSQKPPSDSWPILSIGSPPRLPIAEPLVDTFDSRPLVITLNVTRGLVPASTLAGAIREESSDKTAPPWRELSMEPNDISATPPVASPLKPSSLQSAWCRNPNLVFHTLEIFDDLGAPADCNSPSFIASRVPDGSSNHFALRCKHLELHLDGSNKDSYNGGKTISQFGEFEKILEYFEFPSVQFVETVVGPAGERLANVGDFQVLLRRHPCLSASEISFRLGGTSNMLFRKSRDGMRRPTRSSIIEPC